jgi:SOS response regulatory protein OraA/RecX
LEAPEEWVNQIIDELQRESFLSDVRYLNVYARSKFEKNGWGKFKIAHELKRQGFNSTQIEDALSAIVEDSYQAKIRELYLKKLSSLKEQDRDKERKVIRYLQSKGYEFELISAVLHENKP